jgi:5-(carboxyamino)imidazole ribonucleotide mutase
MQKIPAAAFLHSAFCILHSAFTLLPSSVITHPVNSTAAPLVAVVMGSKSDWDTMGHAAEMLDLLEIPHERRVVSAHRTPDLMAQYAREAAGRGIRVIIAGAGGAAHLPGMLAAFTWLPVLGVPVESRALKGLDSLLSIVQMPGGVPVGTLAIGTAGARNAAILATSILALSDENIRRRLGDFRLQQTAEVLAATLE